MNSRRKSDTEEWKALKEKQGLAFALWKNGATYDEVAEHFRLPRHIIKSWCATVVRKEKMRLAR
jgi:hypothetical protein